MGFFVFDDNRPIQLDDRVLAHLQVVIIDKLRRNESFELALQRNGVLVSMWVNCQMPIEFVYEGNRQPRINWRWAQVMSAEAGFSGTLRLLPEPVEAGPTRVEASSPAVEADADRPDAADAAGPDAEGPHRSA
ncbi:ATP-dependent DNA ligase [Agromyces sp. MMS24-JH15]|uniref:DUF7882 family protein n=1 Tax=Agromyces sp. MMS24-JH15 TaxID=3243765 RepID=UPI0037488332